MTVSTKSQDVPAIEDSSAEVRKLAAMRTFYRDLLGGPVEIDERVGRVVVVSGLALSAIRIPGDLAVRVVGELHSKERNWPVLRDVTGDWWTVLTQSCGVSNPRLPAGFRAGRVHAIPAGGHILLPSPTRTESSPQWVVPPTRPLTLPTWSWVLAATRRVLARQRA